MMRSGRPTRWAGMPTRQNGYGWPRGAGNRLSSKGRKIMNRQNAREAGRIILAHGEVTGHQHEVVLAETGLPPGLEAAQFFEGPDGSRELIVLEPCALRHQEHAPIQLTPDSTVQWRQGD